MAAHHQNVAALAPASASGYPASVLYMLATYGVDLRPVWDLQFASYPTLSPLHNIATDPPPAGCTVSGNILLINADVTFSRWDLRNTYILSPNGVVTVDFDDCLLGMTGNRRIIDSSTVTNVAININRCLVDVNGSDLGLTSPFLFVGNTMVVTIMNTMFINAPNDYTQFFCGGKFIFKRNYVRAWAQNNSGFGGHAEAHFLDGRIPNISPSGCIDIEENLYDASDWLGNAGLTGVEIIKPSIGVSLPGCQINRNIYLGVGTPGMGLVYLTVTGTFGGTDTVSLNVSNNIVQTDPGIFVAMVDAGSDPNVTLTGGQNINFADNAALLL